jgi:hypothetical protein
MTNDQATRVPDEQPRVRRLLSNKRSRWTVIATTVAVLCAVVALAAGLNRSPSATAAQNVTASTPATAPAGAPAGGPRSGGGTPNARSGPAAGGAAGTVGNVSTSGFTLTTPAGKQVTVNEAPTTTYQDGTSSAAAGTVAAGDTALVLGTTDGTTITATQVILHPTGDYGAAASSAAGVVPFQQGTPSAAKQVGQVPANYTEGSGTVVSGTAADKATEAALAAYPGGIVDRVVQLSDGEYEVHNIGVNWPHHVFVNQAFAVVGAN